MYNIVVLIYFKKELLFRLIKRKYEFSKGKLFLLLP